MKIKETFGQAIAMISIEYSGGSLYGHSFNTALYCYYGRLDFLVDSTSYVSLKINPRDINLGRNLVTPAPFLFPTGFGCIWKSASTRTHQSR